MTKKKSSLRIAQLAPIIERVPPRKYGGTERMIHALTEELVKRGHDVTLFASGDSKTSAKLVSVYPKPLRGAKIAELYGANPWTMLNIGLAYKKQGEFDIIHDHNNNISLPAANLSKTPVVMTFHGAFSAASRKMFEQLNNIHLVAISNAQAAPVPNLNYAGMVYNGLNMEGYPFSSRSKGYLLFVGRISPEKGLHFAIEVAQYLDLPLIIAAKLEDIEIDVQYFREYIEPKLSDQVRWVGEVDDAQRNKLMSEAICFLHPVTWREPFGLTLIEAMACGCPVVAFRKGSIPEIVKDGLTGYVVEDTEQMVEAVNNIYRIDRRFCRNYARVTFSAGKMADGYENIYNRVLENLKHAPLSQNNKKFLTF